MSTTKNKKKLGRPTDYTPALLAEAEAFLAYAREGTSFPSIAGLALFLDLSRDTVHEWRKDKDKKPFSDIVERILALQEHRLTENGLNGSYNASITKLLMTKHGYTDKQDITSDDKPVQPLLVRFLDANPADSGDTERV